MLAMTVGWSVLYLGHPWFHDRRRPPLAPAQGDESFETQDRCTGTRIDNEHACTVCSMLKAGAGVVGPAVGSSLAQAPVPVAALGSASRFSLPARAATPSARSPPRLTHRSPFRACSDRRSPFGPTDGVATHFAI
jgi:hypothetical protein